MTKNKKLNEVVVLKALEKDSVPLIKKLEAIKVIKTESDYDKARALLKELKTLGNKADEELKSFIDPLNDTVKRLRDFFRPFQDGVKKIELTTKKNMLSYINRVNVGQLKLDKAFDSGKVSAEKYVSATRSNTVEGSRKVYKLIEVDAKLTPREFLVPDEAAIRQAFKDGKKVKGWKWEQVDTVVV